MQYISVTFDVSKFERSIDVISEHSRNALFKLVTIMSAGLSHLHLPSASGVTVYLSAPLIFIVN